MEIPNIFELLCTLKILELIYLDKNICPDSSVSFVYARVSPGSFVDSSFVGRRRLVEYFISILGGSLFQFVLY